MTDRLKISHAHLAAINPRVITCATAGFGESGPARDWPAFDMVAQAMGGGMTLTGRPGEPQRSGIPIGDLGGGLMGVIGILSAVVARATTGAVNTLMFRCWMLSSACRTTSPRCMPCRA